MPGSRNREKAQINEAYDSALTYHRCHSKTRLRSLPGAQFGDTMSSYSIVSHWAGFERQSCAQVKRFISMATMALHGEGLGRISKELGGRFEGVAHVAF
ncbi:hypothetical protein PoB_002436100 [Plakobranchus ocellatus]|uniref:Uncharacterized protein n=1 Tax=Plakobranchus ocellatus TaxID=259542 RepID=A0AAV3ZTK2_9GAST|nr:hypothetical protein PoB_002436100 [Plakobranchus ocellatus]